MGKLKKVSLQMQELVISVNDKCPSFGHVLGVLYKVCLLCDLQYRQGCMSCLEILLSKMDQAGKDECYIL